MFQQMSQLGVVLYLTLLMFDNNYSHAISYLDCGRPSQGPDRSIKFLWGKYSPLALFSGGSTGHSPLALDQQTILLILMRLPINYQLHPLRCSAAPAARTWLKRIQITRDEYI